MNIKIEEIENSCFSGLLEKHDELYASQFIILDEKKKSTQYTDNMEDIIIKYPQIQMSIYESLLGSSMSIIYAEKKMRLSECESCNFTGKLVSIYKQIHLIEKNDYIIGYMVRKLRDEAKLLFNSLKTKGRLNKYIYLFDKFYVDKFCEPFRYYRIECKKPDLDLMDGYIYYIKKSMDIVKTISIPFIGFTKEQIMSSGEAMDFVCLFSNIYIIFEREISVGAYIFSH
jgi:hypothetical protein